MLRKSLKHHRKHELSYGFVAYFKDLRNLIIEFGPSEILDVMAVRPFFMYLMPKVIGEFVFGDLYWEDDRRCGLFHSRHRDVRSQEKTFCSHSRVDGFRSFIDI